MLICEATKAALESGKYITQKRYMGKIKIRPEIGIPCTIMEADGSRPSKYGWQPTADALISEDWIVID